MEKNLESQFCTVNPGFCFWQIINTRCQNRVWLIQFAIQNAAFLNAVVWVGKYIIEKQMKQQSILYFCVPHVCSRHLSSSTVPAAE